jgi:hypothetical protein
MVDTIAHLNVLRDEEGITEVGVPSFEPGD